MKESLKNLIPIFIKWTPLFILLFFTIFVLVPRVLDILEKNNSNNLKEYYEYKLETEKKIFALEQEISIIRTQDSLKENKMKERETYTNNKIQNYKQLKPNEKIPVFIDQYNRVRDILKRANPSIK